MDWTSKTIEAYDKNAKKYAEYFDSFGARKVEINKAFKFANIGKKARVVEIGCGSGRDAEYIVKKCNWYEGFDPSSEFIKISKAKVPTGRFLVADALSYNYPENIDIFFAFASLLHVNINDIKIVFKRIAKSIRIGGVIMISLKYSNEYKEVVKKDPDNGTERMFYHYSVRDICNVADKNFTIVFEDHQKINNTDWFTVVLKRI